MTNLDKMKQNIISQITLMDAETFLDFINVLQGQYIEDKIYLCTSCFAKTRIGDKNPFYGNHIQKNLKNV